MDIIDYVSGWLELSREEATKNSKIIDNNLTYYWNPSRGGKCLIADKDGNYLIVKGFVPFEQILEEFNKGRRTSNFFTEDRFSAMVREYVVSPDDRQEVVFGASFGKIIKPDTKEGEENAEKVDAIKKVISDNMDKIVAVNGKHVRNYKGGMQKMLNVRDGFKLYNVIGNTDDEESKTLYDQLREEISKIVNS